MRTKKTERPFVAWSIFREMLEGMDDRQLETVYRFLRAEQRDRRRRVDPRQFWLLGGQAVKEVRR